MLTIVFKQSYLTQIVSESSIHFRLAACLHGEQCSRQMTGEINSVFLLHILFSMMLVYLDQDFCGLDASTVSWPAVSKEHKL